MRKLLIILIGLIAVVNFIRAFDNFGSLKVPTEVSEKTGSDVFISDQLE